MMLPTSRLTIASPERRKRLRFPLDTELRYSRHGGGGSRTGRVVDISSKGLAFHADGPLEAGWLLNVSMAWPAKLDNQTLLRLAFEGTVLRVQGGVAVVTINRPEFRTAGTCNAAARDEIAAMSASIQLLVSEGVSTVGSGCGLHGAEQ
jgi:hypothetical protein